MHEENSSYHPIQQPNEIATRDKEDAMGAYLMMFGALAAGLPLPIMNLIAAVVYYFVNAKKSRFIKFHSLQSLLSQAPTTLMNAGLLYWTISSILNHDVSSVFNYGIEGFEIMEGNFGDMDDLYWGYLWTVVAANLLYVIFSIVGAMKARKGEMYYFIFFGKLAYHFAFRRKDSDNDITTVVNLPPK